MEGGDLLNVLKVEQTVWIAAPRERVWQAITDPAQLNRWWAPNTWELSSLDVGATVRFGVDDDVSIATIEDLDPPHRFALRWQPETAWPEIEDVDVPLRTVYVLEEEEGGTRVTVTETGFESLPESVRQRRLESTNNGYIQVLRDLKHLVEAGSNQP